MKIFIFLADLSNKYIGWNIRKMYASIMKSGFWNIGWNLLYSIWKKMWNIGLIYIVSSFHCWRVVCRIGDLVTPIPNNRINVSHCLSSIKILKNQLFSIHIWSFNDLLLYLKRKKHEVLEVVAYLCCR